MNKFETNYSRAWKEFTQTNEFTEVGDPTTVNTDPQHRRYMENRLEIAFAAGWNAKTSSILEAIR